MVEGGALSTCAFIDRSLAWCTSCLCLTCNEKIINDAIMWVTQGHSCAMGRNPRRLGAGGRHSPPARRGIYCLSAWLCVGNTWFTMKYNCSGWEISASHSLFPVFRAEIRRCSRSSRRSAPKGSRGGRGAPLRLRPVQQLAEAYYITHNHGGGHSHPWIRWEAAMNGACTFGQPHARSIGARLSDAKIDTFYELYQQRDNIIHCSKPSSTR